MTKKPHVVRVTLGTPRLGLWCDACLTSARCEVDLLSITEHGVSVLGTKTACVRCDGERSTGPRP